jgi:hypothetical protein
MVGKFHMDRVTQILTPHIGDARSGKWRDLPPQSQEELTRVFRPFFGAFRLRLLNVATYPSRLSLNDSTVGPAALVTDVRPWSSLISLNGVSPAR